MVIFVIFGALITVLLMMEMMSFMGKGSDSVSDIEQKMDETEELMTRTEHKTRISISSDELDDDEDDDDYFEN
ncbi:MAG: hypothetical protein ACPG7F_17960 [Aggregatilineales bacterium]